MRPTLMAAALALATGPLAAAPVHYDLQKDASTVAFETRFGAQTISGDIPLASADLVLDFERLSNCTINVVLDAAHAGASFPFAAEALRGDSVLDARDHPKMTFRSTSVKPVDDGAKVTGKLTIRGITRTVTLDARIRRQKGTEAGDLSRLTVRLTGTVNRSDFGATGFADLVSDRVGIEITARITRRD